MRIHHLNCGTMAPLGGRLVSGGGSPRLVAHCLLIEGDAGLILIDTGFGTADVADGRGRLGGAFVTTVRPRLDPAETAVAQVRALGHRPADVRHVVLTHLDSDHAGGLADFPQARVHVHATEHRAALAARTIRERGRYRPAQWAHGPLWDLHGTDGDDWFGFTSTRPLDTRWPDVRLIPLAGHTLGHTGIAVPDAEGRWLLHAGDAYFHRGTITGSPRPPVGLRLFERLVQTERAARLANVERLRELARDDRVDIFCAHDPAEYARISAPGTPRT